jgi:glutaredoxin
MEAQFFHLEGCPYCRRVRGFIAHRGLERFIEYREVSRDPEALDRLVELTGRSQVPVLDVDGEPIVGSEVIIDWLDENALSLSRNRRQAAARGGDAGAGSSRRAM